MTDVTFNRGYLKAENGTGASVNGSQLLTTIAAKLMFMDLGSSILLAQAPPLVAPTFVVQRAPFGLDPWWIISVVQYHSISASNNTCLVNVWRMFALESKVDVDIMDQELYLYPRSKNSGGLVNLDTSARLNFRPQYNSDIAASSFDDSILSLVDNEPINLAAHLKQLEDLTGRKRHGLLTHDKIREDYPKVRVGRVVEAASQKYTLETEVKKLLGIQDDN